MTTQTTILIAGSRTLPETSDNLQRLDHALDEMHAILCTEENMFDFPAHLVHGGAAGADQLAKQLAAALRLQETEIRPDYETYPAKLAPLKRNDEMINMADAVIVFYAPGRERKGGSWHVAENTVKAGKHLLEIFPSGVTRHTPPQRIL